MNFPENQPFTERLRARPEREEGVVSRVECGIVRAVEIKRSAVALIDVDSAEFPGP